MRRYRALSINHSALICSSPTSSRNCTPYIQRFSLPRQDLSTTRLFEHKCGVLAEPLDRYEPGGYHPVRLHDVFAGGRYKVIHKLGHGSFSTTWIARDLMLRRNVALKITVAEALSSNNPERRVLQALSKSRSTLHSDRMHVVQLLDSFQHDGPNGVHDCLVFELLGPSVANVVEKQCAGDRLPGHVARKACKELGLALAVLHRQEIGHGDIHTGNLAFCVPGLDSLSENKLYETYGMPKTGAVTRTDGGSVGPGVPDYLVWSASFPASRLNLERCSVKLVDFGESFFPYEKPKALHTPMALRAPETLFDEVYDFRVDRWGFACAVDHGLTISIGTVRQTSRFHKRGHQAGWKDDQRAVAVVSL